MKLSQKLVDECTKSRYQQIEEKLRQKSMIRATENAFNEEQKRRQQKQVSRSDLHDLYFLIHFFFTIKLSTKATKRTGCQANVPAQASCSAT